MNVTIKGIKYGHSLLTEHDVFLFREGTHYRLYEKMGAHEIIVDGEPGTHFSVWAPNSESVSVMGDFNGWDRSAHNLAPRWDGSGIWEGFIPGVRKGHLYKYFVRSKYRNYSIEKKDPFGFHCEIPPKTASVVWDLNYSWQDANWKKKMEKHNSLDSPMSVYEVHMGSWRKIPEQNNRSLSYTEMAGYLSQYCKDMGFTHVEFLPLMSHPFYASWGYQCDCYFSPSSFYGSPQEMMYMVDSLHQNNIGVIMDWVPSHFPEDGHSLGYFDGTCLFEHMDRRKGYHPDWKSNIFNYGRGEVCSYLISSAIFWLEKYHMDGLRVDGVASMLYLDYSRRDGEWIPNQYGGKENIEAIDFLRRLNVATYKEFPNTQMIAEESTAWSMVSKPPEVGGLGFGMKWNMGWMHDTLEYFKNPPIYRTFHQDELTFSALYMFSENFMLSLSHDEVVHGKGSLLGRMPGDEWQRFANLRLLFGYMYGHPGKKLLFMGGEFGQVCEWQHDHSLEWHVLQYPCHAGLQRWVKELNHVYKKEPALYEQDFALDGFEWIDCSDRQNSILSLIRKGKDPKDDIIVICNFTPQTHNVYKIGVHQKGFWTEILNSDDARFWGSGKKNAPEIEALEEACHGRKYCLSLTLPPLSAIFLKSKEEKTIQESHPAAFSHNIKPQDLKEISKDLPKQQI
ncbi:MAG: 1,4-alpha-glucan branching protein GlgB [Candidatus Omnitrophica bacterium]|nr:1,4-alpha-glucan branching protein GlgB [Candidatus Omnitrophota bacterium]